MTCHEFQTRLTDAIETRGADDAALLAEHGERCESAACRAAWRDFQLLSRAVAAWRASSGTPSPALADRVLREAQPLSNPAGPLVSVPPASRRAGGVQWLSIAVAAALLLLVGLSVRPTSESRSVAIRPHASHGERSVQIADGSRDTAPPEGERPRRESYVALAHEATDFVTDLAMLVVPVDVDDPAESRKAEWFHRLGETLAPVKSGVEGKLGEWFPPPAT